MLGNIEYSIANVHQQKESITLARNLILSWTPLLKKEQNVVGT